MKSNSGAFQDSKATEEAYFATKKSPTMNQLLFPGSFAGTPSMMHVDPNSSPSMKLPNTNYKRSSKAR